MTTIQDNCDLPIKWWLQLADHKVNNASIKWCKLSMKKILQHIEKTKKMTIV